MTIGEKAIFENMLKTIHNYFISDVAANRNISIENIKKIATGEFYLGIKAHELGLVDVLGDMNTAKELIRNELNLTKIKFAEYRKPKTLLNALIGSFSEPFFFIGQGIGSSFVNSRITNRIDIAT